MKPNRLQNLSNKMKENKLKCKSKSRKMKRKRNQKIANSAISAKQLKCIKVI